jgi:hypothetical protein
MTEEKNKNPKSFQRADYSSFKRAVENEFRYFYDANTTEFFKTILETSVNRKVSVRKDEIYWRAQIGYVRDRYVRSPFSPERMKPLFAKAKEGRVNPKGVSYLYLATNMQTAIQEVRPWLGSYITIAQVQIAKDMTLIDCSKNIHKLDGTGLDSIYPEINGRKNDELSNSEIEKCVWSEIDREFSMPVDPSDDTADYVPTQILAELFKADGYDGIIYNSLFAEGKNLALFNIDSAEMVDCKLYQVIDMPPFKFREITIPD